MTVVKLPGLPEQVAIQDVTDNPRERAGASMSRATTCEAVFLCAAPAWQTHAQLVNGQLHKMFLAGAPIVCPHCRNLKPAEGR